MGGKEEKTSTNKIKRKKRKDGRKKKVIKKRGKYIFIYINGHNACVSIVCVLCVYVFGSASTAAHTRGITEATLFFFIIQKKKREKKKKNEGVSELEKRKSNDSNRIVM